MLRSSIIAGILISTIIAAVIWKSHRSPEYAVQTVMAIRSEGEIEAHKKYLTDQGQRIEKFLLLGSPEANTVITKPQVFGDRMSVEVSDAKDTKEFLFVRNGVWQLDDVVFTRASGQPWNARLSEVLEPLRISAAIGSLKTREQIHAADQFLTPKGKKVLLYTLDQKWAEKGAASPHPSMSDPIVRESEVRLPLITEDGSRVCAVFVKNAEWQFDDFILERANNRDVNLAVSYMIDHPLLSQVKMLDIKDMEKLGETFTKWFVIGFSIAKMVDSAR
jgi:hypothetical protein